MTKASITTALLCALLLGILAALPASAFADTTRNAPNNAMVDNDPTNVDGSFHSIENAIPDYDGFDRFRDSTGRPLPGWQYLFNSPG